MSGCRPFLPSIASPSIPPLRFGRYPSASSSVSKFSRRSTAARALRARLVAARARGRSPSARVGSGAVGGGPYPRVFDPGCGTGLWLADLYRRGHGRESLAGVDVSAMMAQETRDRLQAIVGTDTKVQIENCSAVELPFADGSFDLVMAYAMVKHLDDEPFARFLAEAHRVCKPGRRLLLIDSIAPEDDALSRLMNNWERRRDPSHVHNYSSSQWRALLHQQGFAVNRMLVVKTELEFGDWVRRSGTQLEEAAALRREFDAASPAAAAAFAIRRAGDSLLFAWDAAVIEARKP